jgi:small glutamine-rich tetratricopeptide repeat-containing protein alpha
MKRKGYLVAVTLHTEALLLNPTNANILSNRAATYSAAGDHKSAEIDAELAVTVNPLYSKA